MTLAVGGTLNTNKQLNKQKIPKEHSISALCPIGIRSMVRGSESILLNRKPLNGFQGSAKKKNIIVVSYDTKSIQKL